MTKKKIINLFVLLSILSISAIGATTAEERFEAALETSQYRNTDDVFKNLVHILEDEAPRRTEEKNSKDLKLHFADAVIRSVETIFEQIAKYREMPRIYASSSKKDVDLVNSLKVPPNGLTEVAFVSPHSDTNEEINTKHLIQLGILAEIRVSCMAYENALKRQNTEIEKLRFNDLLHSMEQYSNYLDSFNNVARKHPQTRKLTADRLIEPYDPKDDEQQKRWKEDPRREPKIKEEHRQSPELDPAILHIPQYEGHSPEEVLLYTKEQITAADEAIAKSVAANAKLRERYDELVKDYKHIAEGVDYVSAFRAMFLDDTVQKIDDNEKTREKCYQKIISHYLSEDQKKTFEGIYSQLETNLLWMKTKIQIREEMIKCREEIERGIAEMNQASVQSTHD